jgi:DNA-binding transcriptional regulator GbsR (MarR family)
MGKLVQQVKDGNERELFSAKKTIQAVSRELHNKRDSHVLKATELTSDLGNQMTLHKENADKEVNEMKEAIKIVQTEMTNSAQTWQKEAIWKVQNLGIEFKKLDSMIKGHFDQLNSEMNAIELKIFACTTVGCSHTTLPPNDNISIDPG